jgi:hypothetical protein
MALSAGGATMYLASSVNAPEAGSTSVYRFAINRDGNHQVTGLALAGEVEIEGMRQVSALLERPSSLDLWGQDRAEGRAIMKRATRSLPRASCQSVRSASLRRLRGSILLD